MKNVSDSIAIVQTADVLITLARDIATDQSSQILVTVVKSRFSKNNGQFTANVDYDFMRLIDATIPKQNKFEHQKPIDQCDDVEDERPDAFA
jgi:hypothetical protein